MSLKKLALVLSLALAAVLSLYADPRAAAEAAVTSPARLATAQTDLDAATYERRTAYWINRVRAAHDRRRVVHHDCTDRMAERWTRHLVTSGTLYHQSLGRILEECGSSYAGEVLLRGPATPRQAVRAWLNSPGHRRVMLGTSPSLVGVGARQLADGGWVVTVDFTRP